MKIKSNEFYNQFNNKEQKQLESYFKNLNNNISLTKKETKLFNEDFEKAILYYCHLKMPVSKILEILSINKLGTCYKDNPNYWYPLDNAAKIYPLSMKENWMSVYRLSYYLKEDVVPEIFQIALTFTMKRFPTFRTSIRKGFFWNYIDGIKKRFHIYEDKLLPCSYINVSNVGKQSFKAVYYKKRISVEYFHILADGYGATIFLSTLVGTYLELLGKEKSYNEMFLDVNEKPKLEELIDEFTKVEKTNKAKSLVDSKALQLDGRISNVRPCQIIHFDMNTKEIKKLAKDKNVTVTELLLGFLFLVLSYSTSKDGYIKIEVPVNMRKYYTSTTLRNFALYAVISIRKNNITTLDDVLLEIKAQMNSKVNEERLSQTMTYTNRLVDSIRLIPLFIKKPFANLVYGYLGDKVITTVSSNLGNINIPIEKQADIEKMDFVLGTGMTNRVLFSMITCNNILTLTISKSTTNSSVENNLYNLLKQYGINIYVHGSELYENRK